VQIGGHEDRGGVTLAEEVRKGVQRVAAKMITVEPIEVCSREVTLYGIGHGRARGLAKGDDQNAARGVADRFRDSESLDRRGQI